MRRRSLGVACLTLLVSVAATFPASAGEPRPEMPSDMPIYDSWRHYYMADGLPSDKVFALAADEALGRLWVGTDNGVALIEDGRVVRTWGVADGIAHRAVVSVAVDTLSHDAWFGTMGGLTRIAAGGRTDTYTQLNSGLANDVVFGVCVENQNAWFATTAGTGRYRVADDSWDVWTPESAPQHEPWGYSVDSHDSLVFAALWGGGMLEYDLTTGVWKPYMDPDREMEIDLLRDDGIVHNITTGVSYRDGIVWAATYFGLSSYNFKQWRGYMDHDTGLASNFINFVKARGRRAYLCTDKGLSVVDYDTNYWVSYVPCKGDVGYSVPGTCDEGYEIQIHHEGELIETRHLDDGLPNNFLLGCEFVGDQLWLATSHGLARGVARAEGQSRSGP